MARLTDLDPKAMTPAQRRVYEAIKEGPRGGVRGPFTAWLRCPELADRAQALGAGLRFEGRLPGRLRELAILVTARHWSAQFEWYAHAPLAEREGLAKGIVAAIAERRKPEFSDPAEAAVYTFCRELHEERNVSQSTYARVVALLGEAETVELVMLCGYYAMVAMTLNVFAIGVPSDSTPPLAD